MKIAEIQIDNFGKIKNKTFTFSEGITVIYGRNEAGKSTLHTFLLSMLFGMELPRGRNKAASDYGKYEPWDTASFYSGSMRFAVGNKSFLLKRNFYHKEKQVTLVCETDHEELSVSYGDLDILLGGVGRDTFENTWCIRQAKSQTQKDLALWLSDYLTNFMESGNTTVFVQGALAELDKKKKVLLFEQKEFQRRKQEQEKVYQTQQQMIEDEIEKGKEAQRVLREQIVSQKREIEESNINTQNQDKKNKNTQKRNTIKDWIRIAFFGFAAVCLILLAFLFSTSRNLKVGFSLAGIISFIIAIMQFVFLNAKSNKDNQKESEESWKQNSSEAERNIPLKIQTLAIQEALLDQNAQLLEEKTVLYQNIAEELAETQKTTRQEQDIEEKIQALDFSKTLISKLTQHVSKDMMEEIYVKAAQILSDITGEKYDKICFDEQMKITLKKKHETYSIMQTSQGLLEQVYFALRMAVGDVMMQEEEMFYSFDDAFVMYDEERLRKVLLYLAKQSHQSFIFTCHPREIKLLEQENIDFTKIILE